MNVNHTKRNNLVDIHPEATIGRDTSIGSFTFIDKDVIIGEDCWIGPNVTILRGTRIGDRCKIYPGAVLGGLPQDLKYEGEYTTVEIGSNTTVREYVTVNRATKDAWKTTVGDHCLLMAYVHVAHDCQIGNQVILANNTNLAGHVVIQDHAILEGLVAVQQFVKIGAHSFIAGGSLVRKSVPPYVKAAREPLSYVGVNSVGLHRRGFKDEAIKAIQDIYRILFVKGNNLGNSLEIVETTIDISPEREAILEFIRNADRGIMRGFQQTNQQK